jgi:trehalose 6-phosphate synthase/phosphatase
LAIDSQDQSIRHEDRLIEIGSFPCSIDYPAFNEHSDTGGIKSLLENIRSAFGEKKIIFSIDGLDSTNGILLRLDAYRHFLLQNPGYREKVVFIQAIIPASDTTSSGNAGQKRIIDESITRLNEEAGTPDWQPLVYIYSRLEFDELLTLYRVSDLALITPLRDGMIPVAKEFVASRYDHRGTLILSTTAGSVKELQEALWADPFDIDGMAAMMRTALTMPLAEQEQRIRAMQQPLRDCNSGTWVDDYLSRLRTTKARQQNFQVRFFDIQSKNVLLDKYREAKNCLFLLDYDGTLTPFFQLPALAKPDNLLLDILGNIAANPRNAVYIISGRDSRTLESWLGHLPVNIIAEHGARLRYKGGQWEETATPAVKWKEIVAPLMERYVEKCRNSFVEIKDFSIAWHYRNAEPEQARVIGTELYADLLRQTSGMALQVMMGNKIIEVRNSGADKGNAIRKVLQREEQDLILSIGDDRTDEDMFRILADMEKAWTIKVGSEASFARFNLHTPQMVISLLGNLMYLEQQSTK